MKRILAILACVGTLALTAAAWATPVYNGDTYNPTIQAGGNPVTPTESGYYLWSNDTSRFDWSLRWTSNNTPATWFGSIELGTGLDASKVVAVDFTVDANQTLNIYNNIPFYGDLITFKTVTGTGDNWDGIDFSINGAVGNVIGFNLGSTLFNNLTVSSADVTGYKIFIGGNNGTWNTPLVEVQDNTYYGGKTQNFEVPAPVPEPGTLVLLGVGLVALPFLRRFRKQ